MQSVCVCVCLSVCLSSDICPIFVVNEPMELKLGGYIDYTHTSIIQDIYYDRVHVAHFTSQFYFQS